MDWGKSLVHNVRLRTNLEDSLALVPSPSWSLWHQHHFSALPGRRVFVTFQVQPRTPKGHGCWNGRVLAPVTRGTY